MEILILSGQELDGKPQLQHAVFRLRHRVFVDQLGWAAIRRQDGLERDEFDTNHAVHFLVLGLNGTLLAYSRLLPTTQPHLLSHVYPHLLKGKALPAGPNIWEWTRITPVPCPTTDQCRQHDVAGLGFSIKPAGRLLILAIVEWAMANKIGILTTQCVPDLAFVANSVGLVANFLAKPSLTAEKQVVIPMSIHIQPSTPRTMRKLFALEGQGDQSTVSVADRARL
jgi:acyl-homoserine lactone synthase